MKEIDELNKAKRILSQVLGTAMGSLSSNKYVVQEAKNHIKHAINKLESASKKQMIKKNQKSEKEWWEDIQRSHNVGTANLKVVNNMIDDQKRKLDELENKSQKISDDYDTFSNEIITD